MRHILGLAALLACTSCAGEPDTRILVVIDADPGVAGRIAVVDARVTQPDGCARCDHRFDLGDAVALPFSFAVVPRAGSPDDGPLELAIGGLTSDGRLVVERRARTRFRAGRTLLLSIRLEAACEGVLCPSTTDTCRAAACVDAWVDERTLREVRPGDELLDGGAVSDGGPGGDGGVADGGVTDGGVADGGVADGGVADAGASARPSCAAWRDSGDVSGVRAIDPDGAGPLAAFDAYCDQDGDGGGWTLIAKIDGAQTTFAYGAALWLGTTTLRPDAPDLDRAEALLASHHALAITELRIGMSDAGAAPSWLVVPLGETATLRDALAGGERLVSTTATEWAALAGASLPGAPCQRSGIDLVSGNASVRIGLLIADATCARTELWVGVGASTTRDAPCVAFAATAGSARLCGSGTERTEAPRFVYVMGR